MITQLTAWKNFHRVEVDLKKEKECLACFLANEPLSIFSSYEALRLHIIQKHEESAIFSCDICDTIILSVQLFTKHDCNSVLNVTGAKDKKTKVAMDLTSKSVQ